MNGISLVQEKSLFQSEVTSDSFLAKPIPYIEEAISLSREVIIILSRYKNFEPRSLEAYEIVKQDFLDQRYEKICYVLICNDNEIETKLKQCLTNQEDQIIVPFT